MSDASPPQRRVTLLHKVLIGVGLAVLVGTGATLTALNSKAPHSDSRACAQVVPLIHDQDASPAVDRLLRSVEVFEAASRTAVTDGEVAHDLADAATTMRDYQRTKDADALVRLSRQLTSVTTACQGVT